MGFGRALLDPGSTCCASHHHVSSRMKLEHQHVLSLRCAGRENETACSPSENECEVLGTLVVSTGERPASTDTCQLVFKLFGTDHLLSPNLSTRARSPLPFRKQPNVLFHPSFFCGQKSCLRGAKTSPESVPSTRKITRLDFARVETTGDLETEPYARRQSERPRNLAHFNVELWHWQTLIRF